MNSDFPFFSIIVPTYERPEQLRSCLAAMTSLDYPAERFEVIVVDDGSRMPPANIVAGFREVMDVRMLVQENAGPAAARNCGAAEARGEFLAFTDDDCSVDRNWLRAFAADFTQNPQRLLGGRTLNALNANHCSATSQMILDVVYAHYNANPEDAHFFASNNIAMAADLFRSQGGFNPDFRTSEDREFCDRWRARGLRISYAPAALMHHAHPLNARTLWKQHFTYGRGARRFHQIRVARGAEPFRPDWTFYAKLFRASCSRFGLSKAALMPAWLFWSQLANTAGFFYERRNEVRLQNTTSRPLASRASSYELRIRHPQSVDADVAEHMSKVLK